MGLRNFRRNELLRPTVIGAAGIGTLPWIPAGHRVLSGGVHCFWTGSKEHRRSLLDRKASPSSLFRKAAVNPPFLDFTGTFRFFVSFVDFC